MRQSPATTKSVWWRAASGLAARIAAVLVLVLPLAGFGSIEGLLAPSKDLWPRWASADPSSTAEIDHGEWSAFLQKYLVQGEVNRIRYGKVISADRQALERYIAGLASLPITKYNRGQQLA